MPSTRAHLVQKLAHAAALTHEEATAVLSCVFDSITSALQEGRRVEIRGFGAWTLREYKAYTGRNPRTGDSVCVSPKKLPFFKASPELLKMLQDT